MLNEMDKLRNMLDVNRIKYNYDVIDDGRDILSVCFGLVGKREYIQIYNNGQRIISVVYGCGTYGYEKGLLEIMGLLTDEEFENDDVVGYLSAENVYNRIKKYFNSVETKGGKYGKTKR